MKEKQIMIYQRIAGTHRFHAEVREKVLLLTWLLSVVLDWGHVSPLSGTKAKLIPNSCAVVLTRNK